MITERRIFIVTGKSGAGKTRFCLQLLDEVIQRGLNPTGILSPGVYQDGLKTGISLLNAQSGELTPLAVSSSEPGDGPATQRWQFLEKGMQKGSDILAAVPECNIFFLDELGPLEFNRKQGWVEGIDTVRSAPCQAAVVVIRPSLVVAALKQWPTAEVIQIISKADYPALTAKILSSIPQ